MNADDVLSEIPIDLLVALVQNDEEQIEPRHDGCTHSDVGSEGHLPVVPSSYGVGGGEDGRSSVEGGLDSSFGDRDGLLFHGFVNGDLIRDVHLVELVDGADSVVGEHESSGFDRELARFLVLHNGGGETSGGGGLSGGVDGSREESTDVSERMGEEEGESARATRRRDETRLT